MCEANHRRLNVVLAFLTGDKVIYVSGTHLNTPKGSMHGSFQMATLVEEGEKELFDAKINRFQLLLERREPQEPMPSPTKNAL